MATAGKTSSTRGSATRRTQAERRATTRGALLDAAIRCLVDHGYQGTTTGRVSELAGVSRGAHLHHFGTRADLVAAALRELADRRSEQFIRDTEDLPESEPERTLRGLDYLWNWFNGPLFSASVDLAATARTDPELRASLAPVERQLNQTTLKRCRDLFADDPDDSRFDELIQLTLATVRGLAILPILQPGSNKATKQWLLARDHLVGLYADVRAP